MVIVEWKGTMATGIACKRRDGVDKKTLMRLPVVDFYWKVAERNNIIGTLQLSEYTRIVNIYIYVCRGLLISILLKSSRQDIILDTRMYGRSGHKGCNFDGGIRNSKNPPRFNIIYIMRSPICHFRPSHPCHENTKPFRPNPNKYHTGRTQ